MTFQDRLGRPRWLLLGALALALLTLLAARSIEAGAATGPKSRNGPAAKKISLLYVLNAKRATLAPQGGGGYRPTVKSPEADVVWFADRPARDSGSFPSRSLAQDWAGFGFAADPPNVALDYLDSHGEDRTAMLELRRPQLRGGEIVFAARLLDPDAPQDPNLVAHAKRADRNPPRRMQDVSLFVDDTRALVIAGCVMQPYAACENTSFDGSYIPGVDLTGANLSDSAFGEGEIYGANLSKANLSHAQIFVPVGSANLSEANLSGAQIGGPFKSDDLTDANLSEASIEAAFSDSNLTGADTAGVSWSNSTFCATKMPNGTVNNSGCAAQQAGESESPFGLPELPR